MRSPYPAEPNRDLAWTGPTEPCSPGLIRRLLGRSRSAVAVACPVEARRVGGAGRGSRCLWWHRNRVRSTIQPTSLETIRRSAAAPSADHAGLVTWSEATGHGLRTQFSGTHRRIRGGEHCSVGPVEVRARVGSAEYPRLRGAGRAAPRLRMTMRRRAASASRRVGDQVEAA
jgi:hypothetical protein